MFEQSFIRKLAMKNNLMQHYLNDRGLIPPRNLIEIGYRELDKIPLPLMRRIYQKMNFWLFVRARGRIRRYLKSQENYQKNAYQISTEDILAQSTGTGNSPLKNADTICK